MNKLSIWQRMTAYPARRRLVAAIVIVVFGGGIILLQVVPPDLRAQGAAWVSVTLAQLSALDPHILFSVGGGVLILGGILLSVLPALSRSYRAYPPHVAPVSIYFDYENQTIAGAKIPAFAAFINETIGNRRLECFYYIDEAVSPNKSYVALHRYGFRMIPVAHKDKRLGGTNIKNMVDMELALHAYERALLTRERQHIVLIAADRDYLPLLYRLRALGHDVSVWARTLPPAILALREEIGITCVEFGTQFNEHTLEKAATGSIASPALIPTPQTHVTPSAAPSLGITSMGELLTTYIEQALLCWQEASQKPAEKQYTLFLSYLTNKGYLDQIGFTMHHGAQHWATVLKSLGVLTQAKQGTMYGRGKQTALEGAAILARFLGIIVATTREAADGAVDGIIGLGVVRRRLAQLATQPQNELSRISALAGEHINFTIYLLACARALQMVAYREIDQQHIQVVTGHAVLPPVQAQDEPARQ